MLLIMFLELKVAPATAALKTEREEDRKSIRRLLAVGGGDVTVEWLANANANASISLSVRLITFRF